METFLTGLYGTIPCGLVTLWNGRTKASFHTPSIARAAKEALNWDGAGDDAYFGVGLRRADLGASKRGGKIDVVAMPGFSIDVDYGTTGHKASNCPPDLSAACEVLAAIGLDPTLVVNSGGGLHAYYLFMDAADNPCVEPMLDLAAVSVFERALAALQSRAISYAAGKGWHVDNTATVDRVLRVPGTRNHKDPANLRPVVVASTDGPRYEYQALVASLGAAAAPTAPSQPRATNACRALLASLCVPAVSPPATDAGRDPARAIPLKDVRDHLSKVKNQHQARVESLLAGASIANADRDTTMQALTGVVAAIAPHNDPTELVELFRQSVAVWAAEPGATLSVDEELSKVLDKIARNQANIRPKLDAQRADDAETLRSLNEAAKQSQPVPWIVQRGSTYHVRQTDDAFRPYSEPEIQTAINTDLKPHVKLTLDLPPTATGLQRSRPLKTHEVVERYGVIAKEVRADMTIDRSCYDHVNGVFHEAVCPRRPLVARCHAGVHTWLELLGGLRKEKLLDWVATVDRLESPTSALILVGPPGAGKTLLAYGLSRRWTTGKPTDLESVFEQFNDGLQQCPLLLADEDVRVNSTDIRRLTGGDSATLRRKYQNSAPVRGCLRVIIATNSEARLGFDEDLSGDDAQAISERFLIVRVPQAAADYLVGIGGRAATHTWVAGDEIAEHALWLSNSRQIVPGSRFLVQGDAGQLAAQLTVRSGVNSHVAEWLAKHLNRPSPAIGASAAVRVGGGHYLINTNVVAEYWDQYIRSTAKVPSTKRIGLALKELHHRETRVDGVRCHDINVDLVLLAAGELQIGDLDEMRRRVNAPIDADTVLSQPRSEREEMEDALHTAAGGGK